MKKGFIILALACIGINVASAQTQMRSAYFLDGYNFRHQMNPAFAGARSYFSLPALGYTNIGISSNLGIDTFLYPTADGGLTTFMNRSVDSRTFLGKLDKNNYLYRRQHICLLDRSLGQKKRFHDSGMQCQGKCVTQSSIRSVFVYENYWRAAAL